MKSLKFLNQYFFRYKTRLILGALFVTVSNIFAIYPAEILRKGIDLVMDGVQVFNLFEGASIRSVLSESFFNMLLIFGLVVIATALLKGLFMFFMRQTIIVMSRLIEYDLKNDIFAHYQKLDLAFYKSNKTGDLMARISEDVSQVRMYVGPAIMYAVSTLSLFFLVTARMISINAELTLYVLIPLPILAITIYFLNSFIIKKSEAVQKQLSAISSFVQEMFSGIRVIKAYNREAYTRLTFEDEALKYKDKNIELVRINAMFFPMIILLIGLSTLITVFVGGQKVFSGEITTGTIAEFILYVNMLTWPVASIGWVTSIVQRAAASQTRINEFLNRKPKIENTQPELSNIQGEIEFNQVRFVYPESHIEALHSISFKIESGKSLAIVGRTGSGKSTVASLICRLYDTTQGEITIDGVSITKTNLDSLRSSIGYAPQEVFLFSDSIGNNISFGLKNSKLIENVDERVQIAAKDASIYESIAGFPKGFDTLVGERGLTLSGGQKQRISIARALIREPKILILDDCLSAVDTETEEKILQSIKKHMLNRTTIIISHRMSSVMNCDSIIVLEDGIIAEQGNHQELMLLNGIYAEMYQNQLLEEEQKSE